eukprot:g7972.t1
MARKKKDADKAAAAPAPEPKMPLHEEINLTSGVQRGKDNSYDKSTGVMPASLQGDQQKNKAQTPTGECATVLGAVDADLPVYAQEKLNETGLFEEYVAFPWAVIKPGIQSGSPIAAKGCGYSAYLITMAQPKDTSGSSGASGAASSSAATTKKSKKKKKSVICCPSTITAEVFLERIWEAYGQIGKWLQMKYDMHLNFTALPFSSATQYITQGSSRKFQYAFVGDPIVTGASLANTVANPMDFFEFRELVDDRKITKLDALHRETVSNVRLDAFVNGDGSNRNRARQKLACALESLRLRKSTPTTLIDALLAAENELECVCHDRTVNALMTWSRNLRWSDNCKPSEAAAAIQCIHWAINGRGAGNTMVMWGPTGTGKSWWAEMLKACLGERYFAAAQGEQSYPFEQLGWSDVEKLALLFDEVSPMTMNKFLTNSKGGWWKMWLQIQTESRLALGLPKNREYDRHVFAEPAPILYTATVPIRLQLGMENMLDETDADRENEQQRRRELRAHCPVQVCRGAKQRILPRGKCFSKYLNMVNAEQEIYCRDTKKRLKTDIEIDTRVKTSSSAVCEPNPAEEKKARRKVKVEIQVEDDDEEVAQQSKQFKTVKLEPFSTPK